MKRNLTCIVCPLGCSIEVTLENGKVTEVKGNSCPRGAKYANDECTNPTRVVTSTVMSKSGKPVSVKTAQPIPKGKIFECMDAINSAIVTLPVKIGDVAVENVADTGVNVIVTQNIGAVGR